MSNKYAEVIDRVAARPEEATIKFETTGIDYSSIEFVVEEDRAYSDMNVYVRAVARYNRIKSRLEAVLAKFGLRIRDQHFDETNGGAGARFLLVLEPSPDGVHRLNNEVNRFFENL